MARRWLRNGVLIAVLSVGALCSGLAPEAFGRDFVQPGTVVFSLGELPHVIFACGYDLYSAPIAELKPLLTEDAADYFPELRD